MRIITGKHKSRVLKTLDGLNTRPMMDKMKESVFQTIGPYFDGGEVLDLFGGSGALTLESLSRGATHAYINELNRDALVVIKYNIQLLNEEKNVSVINADYKVALKRVDGIRFDYVFLDPPYRMNVTGEIVNYLIEHEMLNDKCFIICHYVKGNAELIENPCLKVIKNYAYGASEVAIYEFFMDKYMKTKKTEI